MKITALVENQSNGELTPRHGLSLYIETKKHRILFDTGPDDTLFENSAKLGIDLSKIDTVILSHGHMDHGGALRKFLQLNDKATVYAQRKAFEKHSSKFLFLRVGVGIDATLEAHPQVILLDGDHVIDDELKLFTVPDTKKYHSPMNDVLYAGTEKDNFSHEQNLMVCENTKVLVMGCGHAGVVNILDKASGFNPQICVGGYHLWNPLTKKTVPDELLEDISRELAKREMRYYTCHCTGRKAYMHLAQRVPGMKYLACGETIEI